MRYWLFNKKKLVNTMVYIVELPDESTEQYAANIIAENILYQVD